MSSFANSKKRRQQITSRIKQPKGVTKPTVQDLFPFEVPNLQSLTPEIKQYINELQKEYIERYNILVSNRIIYEQIIENISTELDEKGVTVGNLADNYKFMKYQTQKMQEM